MDATFRDLLPPHPHSKPAGTTSASLDKSLQSLISNNFFVFSPSFGIEMRLKTLIGTSLFSSSSSANLHLLKVGDVLRKSRTFSHLDLLDYSKVSCDSNPIHFDANFARTNGFDDRVVYGMLVASLFPRIIASNFPGAIYVSQSLKFKLPVYIGEEVVAEVKVLNLRENKQRHLAKFSTKCFKNGELVIDGEAVSLLPCLVVNEEQCQS